MSQLVDYLRVERSVLLMAANFLGPIKITADVFDEIAELAEEDCEELGLQIVEASLEQITQVASTRRGKLSHQDRL